MKTKKARGGKSTTSGKSGTPVGGKKFKVDGDKLAKIAGGKAGSSGKGPLGKLAAN